MSFFDLPDPNTLYKLFPALQLKQFNLGFIIQSKQKLSLSQSTQSCILCWILSLSDIFVQSIKNVPDIVFPSDNDMKPSKFIIVSSWLNLLKLRLVEISP